MKQALKISVIVLLLASLTACGSGEAPPAESAAAPTVNAAQTVGVDQNIEVLMNDIWYGENANNLETPPLWTVKAGAQIAVKLINKGALEHDWTIIKSGEEVPVPFKIDEHNAKVFWEAGVVKGGQENVAQFTAPEAGTYTVICSVAGHFPSMQGKLIVEQ